MTREQKVDKAICEAYEFLCQGAIDEAEEFLYNISFEYVDFTDETFEFINKELEGQEDEKIIYDIMEPAARMVLKIMKKALLRQ